MNEIEKNSEVQTHHDTLEKTHHSSRKVGMITIFLIFGLFGIWSIFANIATTITANGKVITASYNKIVTHPKGGIVKKIYVHDGDVVKKGDKLLEIDSTQYQSSLNGSVSKHDANVFTIYRMEAEAAFAKELDCSILKETLLDPEQYLPLASDTVSLFLAEMDNLESDIALLKSKNTILFEQNTGLKNEIVSNKRLLESYTKELTKWKKLLKQNAVDEQKSIEIERKIEQIHQEINSLKSRIKENLATAEANKRQIVTQKNSFKNDALRELNRLKLENKMTRSEISFYQNSVNDLTLKSPGEGRVTDMKIHAAGEVAIPQKPIMSIVPKKKKLKIEAYVLPTDIEKIYIEQKTEISFSSFVDPSAIPILGEITYISADSIIPEGMDESMYRILVKFTPEGLQAIETNGFTILPGMPATIFVKTGEMTLMEYIMQPLIQLSKGLFHAN